MPNIMRKIRNKNLYKVYNVDTGRIHSKGTTYENAEKQLNLLNRIEGNGYGEFSDYPKLQRDLNMSIGAGVYHRFK